MNTFPLNRLFCLPPAANIFANLREATSPPDPWAQFFLTNSTPVFPFIEVLGGLDYDCHHCHKPHVIEYTWAIFKTGAPARAPQDYTIDDKLTEKYVQGVQQRERFYNIGDYIGAIT